MVKVKNDGIDDDVYEFKENRYYQIKELTVPDDYILKGKPLDVNNYGKFIRWFPDQFDGLGLWDRKEQKPNATVTKIMVLRSVDQSLHETYMDCVDGQAVWDLIHKNYKGDQANSKARLLFQIVKFMPSNDMDVALAEHANQVRVMINAFGKTMDTETVVQLLFTQNLSNHYRNIRTDSIAADSFDFERMKIKLKIISDDLKLEKLDSKGKLLKATENGDEMSILKKKIEDMSKAMMVKDGKVSSGKSTCPVHPEWKLFGNPCLKCNPCRKCVAAGVFANWHKEGGKNCQFQTEKAQIARIQGRTISGPVDSGCSSHTFANKSVFDFYSNQSTFIETANGEKIPVPGKGDSFIVDTLKGPAHFKDALHCPDLSEDALFSVSKFDQSGFTSVFTEGKYLLIPKNDFTEVLKKMEEEAIIKGKRRSDNLYYIELNESTNEHLNPVVQKVFIASVAKRTAMEWHLALNHPSPARLKCMVNGLVDGIAVSDKIQKDCDCGSCFMGKAKQLPYPKKSARVIKQNGDLISCDGWGRVRFPDWNGNTNYLAFIDHHSGKSFTRLYSSPSQISTLVVEFLKEVAVFLGHPVKIFRADKEGGFVSKQVKNYCKSVGTKIEYSLTDAHQQMGVMENFHLHCLETVRTMLTHSQLGHSMWGEAVLNHNYTRNKMPTSGRTKCPDEIWYGQRMDVHHLRAFGETCYAFIMQKDQDSKIDPRAYAAVFLGYDEQTKAYRLLDKKTNSMFLSRSVQFLKNMEWPDVKELSRFDEIETLDSAAIVNNADGEYKPESDDDDDEYEIFNSSNRYDVLKNEGNEIENDEKERNESNCESEYFSSEEMDESNRESRSGSDLDPEELISRVDDKQVDRSEVSSRNILQHKRRGDRSLLFKHEGVSLLNAPPEQYGDIAGRMDSGIWYEAAKKEMTGIVQMKVGTVVPRPKNTRIIKNRYVFNVKTCGLAKARLVLKDFVKKGEESPYSPVADDVSFKAFCAISGAEDLDMTQYDVIQAFLHSSFDEDVYTEIPDGWDMTGYDMSNDYVLLLHKTLYGHRKAPYLWNRELNRTLEDIGFVASDADACLYSLVKGDTKMLLLLHVDDFIIADNNEEERKKVVGLLNKKYGIKDLGVVKRYTNYQIQRDRKKKLVYIHQQDYIKELVTVLGMEDSTPSKSKGNLFSNLRACKSASEIEEKCNGVNYRTATGALIHLACHSRPDIAFEVTTLCKYNSKPGQQHWSALKQLVRFLIYTIEDTLKLGGLKPMELVGYADSGFASDLDSGRSPGGFVFFLGESLIAHKSQWFSSVYPSSTETELAALYLCVSMAVWLRKLMVSFGYAMNGPIRIKEDNQGAIKYSKSLERSGRMKHIDVKFHWIREKIGDETVKIEFVSSSENVADIMTKTLGGKPLLKHRKSMGFERPEHLRIDLHSSEN